MPTIAQLGAKEFVNKDMGIYLKSVLICPNGDVVATNGKIMARIGSPQNRSKLHSYPKKDMFVSARAITEFLKTCIKTKDPRTKIINIKQYKRSCTFIQQAGRKMRLNEHAPEETFPDYATLLSKKSDFITDIVVNAKFLAIITAHIKKHGDGSCAMRLCIPVNPNTAIEVHARGKNDEEMLYLLMPVDREGAERLEPEGRNHKFFIDTLDPKVFPCRSCKYWKNAPKIIGESTMEISKKLIKIATEDGKKWCSVKRKFTKGDSTCVKITGNFEHM